MSAIVFDKAEIALGKRCILSDASFSIPEGTFVGVLGPNGAGKTTVLRAMLGLVPIRGGRISVLGSAPRRGHVDIGYMPQYRRGVAQLGLTGFDLVLGALGGQGWGWPFASREDRRCASEALDEVGALELAGRPVCELSGGERQRVLFAQALLRRPKLLLLDEPLISLDPGHQRGIVEAVQRTVRRRGVTALFCAHEVNPLLKAIDLVLYLGNGGAALGPVDDVITSEVLSRLYRTAIDVVRIDGRIFVMSRDANIEIDAHHHHHEDA